MAHWMKHWPALVAVGCGLVALWLLPPDPPRRSRNYVPPTEAQALKFELRAEAANLNVVLKRRHWLDSLNGVLAQAQPDENGVIVSFPEGIDDSEREEFRVQVALEIGRLEIERTEYTFAVAQSDGRSGSHEAFSRDVTTGPEFYTLEAGDRPVCLILRPYANADPLAAWGFGWSSILGPCTHYLIHGTPGPAIGAWLRSGAGQFGMRYAESRNPFGDPSGGSLERSLRALFGVRRSLRALSGARTTRTARAHSCLAGDKRECRNSILDAKRRVSLGLGGDVPAFLHNGPAGGAFYTYEESLFYDLEQEFGREAFGRFWTSDQDVETAFQAAFGPPIGEWVMGWAQARLGVYRMGPMPSLEAIIISLGVISFFLTIAIAMGKRRKVA